MRKPIARATVMGLSLCFGLSTASAHYLWVTVSGNPGPHGTARIYFEEGPGPGDGKYLDPFVERGRTWLRTLDSDRVGEIKPQDTKRDGKRWLTAPLPAAGPRSIESYGMFGVYRYGDTDVLLHYYAKRLDVETRAQRYQLGRAARLKLDIVPVASDGGAVFQVLWDGEPAADRPVNVRGPKRFRVKLTTDAAGRVKFDPQHAGRYTLRTSMEQPERSGTQDGKSYQERRHHGTLVLELSRGF